MMPLVAGLGHGPVQGQSQPRCGLLNLARAGCSNAKSVPSELSGAVGIVLGSREGLQSFQALGDCGMRIDEFFMRTLNPGQRFRKPMVLHSGIFHLASLELRLIQRALIHAVYQPDAGVSMLHQENFPVLDDLLSAFVAG
jgi:hypothetical protein